MITLNTVQMLMRMRMIFFMAVRKHAHIVMQRAVRHRDALRQTHAQHQPHQEQALQEVSAQKLHGLFHRDSIRDSVIQAIRIVSEHLKFSFDHHGLERILHRRFGAHLHHALGPAG